MFYVICDSFAVHSCVCNMVYSSCINLLEVVTCIVHVVLLHCILNYIMFSLFICIIVNIVFILFYLQVEPVYLRVLIKLCKSLLCHQYRQQFYNIGQVCSPDVYMSTVMSLDDVRGHKQSASQRLWSTL